jgi:hypothetical protein
VHLATCLYKNGLKEKVFDGAVLLLRAAADDGDATTTPYAEDHCN